MSITAILPLQRLIRDTIEYTKTRKAFGRPILDNQTVHYSLAELETEVELLRSLLYRTVGMWYNYAKNDYPFSFYMAIFFPCKKNPRVSDKNKLKAVIKTLFLFFIPHINMLRFSLQSPHRSDFVEYLSNFICIK